MNSAQFRDKLTLQKTFTEIAKTDLKDYTREIAKLIADNNEVISTYRYIHI